ANPSNHRTTTKGGFAVGPPANEHPPPFCSGAPMSAALTHCPPEQAPLPFMQGVPSGEAIDCVHTAGSFAVAHTPIETQRLIVRSANVRQSVESAPQAMVVHAESSPLLGKALHLPPLHALQVSQSCSEPG